MWGAHLHWLCRRSKIALKGHLHLRKCRCHQVPGFGLDSLALPARPSKIESTETRYR